ncbi:MAG TPA: sigma-54 dependent transcriptional regulator [Nitrospirota bacterium]|nr:sigma-54 dependent transcriptional regulator [Nitrospirota bacterium]
MRAPARIFLIDDDELIISMLSRALKSEGYDIRAVTSARDVVSEVKSWAPAVILLDIRLPERSGIEILEDIMKSGVITQVVMLTADDTAETAVKAMKLGAVDYLTKPFNIDEVKIVIRNFVERARLHQEVDYLRKVNSEIFDRELIGESAAIKTVKSEIAKMANARVSSILITGESGTGKEIVARYFHRLVSGDNVSRRVPFLGVNCAALPEQLLESELFGFEKGSFTDARADKKGVFELASGGTILLDEIGEMNPNLQTKLLRILEERTVRHIGGKDDIPVDVTVITTTNRNLAAAVESGAFRMDLFFRLSTFYLHVPPLRERKEDIPLLARHFLTSLATRYNKKTVKNFSPEAEGLMMSYAWPGNIRELRNLVERLVVLESAELILPQHLPDWLTGRSVAAPQQTSSGFVLPDAGISLDEVEKNLIKQALDRENHNKARAAKLLGISYDTLRYQVKKLGLE